MTQQEQLALVQACKHFYPYHCGWQFRLWMDLASLAWLLNFHNLEGQLFRWLEVLVAYDFDI